MEHPKIMLNDATVGNETRNTHVAGERPRGYSILPLESSTGHKTYLVEADVRTAHWIKKDVSQWSDGARILNILMQLK